jgi:hypothetical protein
MRDRESRYRAVRDGATAQVTMTADQDLARGSKCNNGDHQALPTVLAERWRYIIK